MDLHKAAIEYTIGQYFSSTADEIGFLRTYELLVESVKEGTDHPELIPWRPFKNWELSELLEQIDSDVLALETLLKQAQDYAGVPE